MLTCVYFRSLCFCMFPQLLQYTCVRRRRSAQKALSYKFNKGSPRWLRRSKQSGSKCHASQSYPLRPPVFMLAALEGPRSRWKRLWSRPRNGGPVGSTLQLCSERFEAVDGGEHRPWPGQVHLARRRGLRWGDPTRQDARQGKVRRIGVLSLAVPLVVLELGRRPRRPHGCTLPCRADCRQMSPIDFELGFYVDGNDSSEAVEFPEQTPKDSSIARPSAPGPMARSTLGRSNTARCTARESAPYRCTFLGRASCHLGTPT